MERHEHEKEYKSQEQMDGANGLVYKGLKETEVREMRDHEDIIATMQICEISAGYALHEIQKRRLYRGQYDTFSEYINQRWKFGVRRAYQLIDAWVAFRAIKQLDEDQRPVMHPDDREGDEWKEQAAEPVVHKDHLILPTRERQLRPFARLAPLQQRQAWAQALDRAGDMPPSSREVEEAVREIKGLPHVQPAPPVRRTQMMRNPRDPQAAAAAIKEAFSDNDRKLEPEDRRLRAMFEADRTSERYGPGRFDEPSDRHGDDSSGIQHPTTTRTRTAVHSAARWRRSADSGGLDRSNVDLNE